MKPGEYKVGVRCDHNVTDHVVMVIEEERHMQFNVRARRFGEMGISTRILEDDFLYMWFEEVPNQVDVSGIAGPVDWVHPVKYSVSSTLEPIVKFDQVGEIVAKRQHNLPVGPTVEGVGRGLIRGETWIPKFSLEIVF